MENKKRNLKWGKRLAVLSAIGLSACATTQTGEDGEILTREEREAIRVGESMVQTSYDYSRPGSIAPDSKPVWVLPVINSGWKPARVDRKTGEWIGGHYSATVVEEGKWATLEEAELSGKPYILPGQTRPVIPTPLKDQSASSTGELNATTLEQKMARLEKLERDSRLGSSTPSSTSLANQAAIPTLPPVKTVPPTSVRDTGSQGTRKPATSPMKIPGLTTDTPPSRAVEGPEKSPSVLLDPPKMPPPPPPLPEVPNSDILSQTKSSPSPASSASKSPVMLNSPTPPPQFDSKTGEIILSYAPPGSTAKVNTPKGEVSVTYGDGGKTTISLGKKSKTVTLKNPNEKIKIKIPN
jgi:hypothetical protein